MYLFQKLKYKFNYISESNYKEYLEKDYSTSTMFFDTETTGLHIIKDKPFLIQIGNERNEIFIFHINEKFGKEMFYHLLENTKRMVAHNLQFDYNMLTNVGWNIKEDMELVDTMVLARLTEFADDDERKSLEALGAKYVDKEAKFAGHVIKKIISDYNKKVRKETCIALDKMFKKKGREIIKAYDDRVPYVDYPEYKEAFEYLDENYELGNYETVDKLEPNLMRCYGADDIVILKEYYDKAIKAYLTIDPEQRTLKVEMGVIRATIGMERAGFELDIDYLLQAREDMNTYRQELYDELYSLVGKEFSVGQHAFIKTIFSKQFGIELESSDAKTLKKIAEVTTGKPSRVASLIVRLRNLDKWVSTYVEGKLKSSYNGHLYATINTAGAVTGRVSSDMQQQPKYALENELGIEIFHPRRAIKCPKGYYMCFED